jgi:thiosulfate/3-mercaptopyruvate sulfurtransferase
VTASKDAGKSALVSTDWLSDHLPSPDLVVIDASWHLPGAGLDAYQEYLDGRIPGSVFFDIDDIADTTSPLPHMLPSPEKFASRMRALGIGDGTRVICYDSYGLFSAARAWWMFRVMGHDDVAVLDGGLKKWLSEDRSVEDGKPAPRGTRHFTARLDTTRVRDGDQVLAALENGHEQVLDARPAARFAGAAPEPRPELPSGHMPNSLNLHYAQLLNEDGTVKARRNLQELFDGAGLDLKKPVTTSCGSGVTAAILTLGLYELGHDKTALYDGSWTDWASTKSRPIEKA